MLNRNLKPGVDAEFPADDLELCRNSVLWRLWSLAAAQEALQWPPDELGLEVAACPDYAQKILNIYKMLLADRALANFREDVAKRVLDHVQAALLAGGCLLAGDLLQTPIDFAVLPRFHGLDADEVNALRLGPR